jgi:(S)-mandelate dehydrogenase
VKTLVVTIDANTFGNREWNARLYVAEAKPGLAARLDVLRHPRWLAQVYRHGLPGFPNIADWLGEGARDLLEASRWLRQNIAPTVSWYELEQVRRLWSGRMLIKGITHVEDARRAMALGADGVVLGNHGGRQLDGAVTGMDLLASVRDMLGGQATVLVEGASAGVPICSRRICWVRMGQWGDARRSMASRRAENRARSGSGHSEAGI